MQRTVAQAQLFFFFFFLSFSSPLWHSVLIVLSSFLTLFRSEASMQNRLRNTNLLWEWESLLGQKRSSPDIKTEAQSYFRKWWWEDTVLRELGWAQPSSAVLHLMQLYTCFPCYRESSKANKVALSMLCAWCESESGGCLPRCSPWFHPNVLPAAATSCLPPPQCVAVHFLLQSEQVITPQKTVMKWQRR